MESNKVAIIIPAYNEESSIGDVIRELVDTIQFSVKIVVVNDSSTDNTSQVASEAGAYVVDLKFNHGYAMAINEGLAYACANFDVKYLLTMDADGQHVPESAQLLILSIESGGFDLVVGRRPESARIAEWLYGKYFSAKFKISDPLCGLKIYRREVYQEYGTFETFDSIGTELLTWSLIKGFCINELPVNIRSRVDKPRFGSTWRANKRIFFSLLKSRKYIKFIEDK